MAAVAVAIAVTIVANILWVPETMKRLPQNVYVQFVLHLDRNMAQHTKSLRFGFVLCQCASACAECLHTVACVDGMEWNGMHRQRQRLILVVFSSILHAHDAHTHTHSRLWYSV